jgi:hypothetical protein
VDDLQSTGNGQPLFFFGATPLLQTGGNLELGEPFLSGRIIFGGSWIMSGVNYLTHHGEMDTVHARQDEKHFDRNMALIAALFMFVQGSHLWLHSLGM